MFEQPGGNLTIDHVNFGNWLWFSSRCGSILIMYQVNIKL